MFMSLTCLLEDYYHRADILSKLYWAGLNAYSSASVYFLQSFTLTTDTTTALLNETYNGASFFDVACSWVKQNEATWSFWILPGTCLTRYLQGPALTCVSFSELQNHRPVYHYRHVCNHSGVSIFGHLLLDFSYRKVSRSDT